MSWMRLPKEYSGANAEFVILPIEYENAVTFGKGAVKGSKEIVKASEHLEYYDEQFGVEAFEKGIIQEKPLGLKNANPEAMIQKVSKKIGSLKDKFVVSLGGDHSVSIGIVNGLEKNNDNFSVIVLDAHSDFRDSWNSSQYNHACVCKQISKSRRVLAVGIRSMDVDEKEVIEKNKNIKVIKAYEYNDEKFSKFLENLDKKVYVSIDVDVFDPSIMRNTGTPEPGGFSWDRVINILKKIFETKQVIGADIVEFCPIENYRAEAYTLAKLAYKIIGLSVLHRKPKTI